MPPEAPRNIESRAELRELLSQKTSGGIYFSTLQKFGLNGQGKLRETEHPLLSDRSNIVVIVDEIAVVLECLIEHVEPVELLVIEVFHAPLLGNIHGLFNIRLIRCVN